jgi:hypothetical protein
MHRRRAPAVLFLVVLAVSSLAHAAPPERGAAEGNQLLGWFLDRLQPLLELVLPATVGPDADPNGVSAAPPPESQGDEGPDADPNG